MDKKKIPRIVTGKVIRINTQKTIAVETERRVRHSMYGKFIRRTRTLIAHDEKNICNVGDIVVLSECSPISKRKTWSLEKVLICGR